MRICHQVDGRKIRSSPLWLRTERLEVTGSAEECGEKTQQPVERNRRCSIRPEKMFMLVDALTFPCFALSVPRLTVLIIFPRMSGNLTWKKNTFQPFGTQQRICVLQAGVPALTTSGEPWGNCKAEGCWKSLQWSPPTPYRVHCWPLCPDMYVQKAHVKDQEVFLCCSLHCQYFPPPSSSSYRTTCDL